MSNMSRLAQAIEENCDVCREGFTNFPSAHIGCENCKVCVDIGDKIVVVNGKTHEILSVKLKEEEKKKRVLSFYEKYSKGLFTFDKLKRLLKRVACACVVLCVLSVNANAQIIDVERLANAIYKAEGGCKTSHPYGIMKKYEKTSARQACINTIKHALRDFDGRGDFIVFLGSRYCPTKWENSYQATRAEYELNRYWVKNVTRFYNKGV